MSFVLAFPNFNKTRHVGQAVELTVEGPPEAINQNRELVLEGSQTVSQETHRDRRLSSERARYSAWPAPA